MVVRRSMNKTDVLKVYLIGTTRYTYSLHFKRAKVPDWVTTTMNSIGDIMQPSVLKTRPRKQRTLELGSLANLIQGTQMKLPKAWHKIGRTYRLITVSPKWAS